MSNITLPISSICFIDANIIFYIEKLKSKDGFLNIIEQVYESVYIHEEVYKELSSMGQRFVDEKCDAKKWLLFKPVHEFQNFYEDYMFMLSKIQSTLIEVDTKRRKTGSAGTGEIASLAAAYLLNAEFICSNDYSIEEVIREIPLHIFIDGDDSKEPVLITHHRLLDFCRLVVDAGILPRNAVKKFFQIAHIELKSSNRPLFDEQMAEFDQLIQVT
ncbi:hypothetical protein [Sporosarcina limicola]|uniref:Nucleic acid-binding protein n=1 Tax=Sporosarcina limicola TaxID=34101 RepID=A0A927R520_9BACL|nr:hypothetical protein [Sporosarcina limicola]MBE1555513.1 putative nucleic acid-binding protein [Sporosarcina limicola]